MAEPQQEKRGARRFALHVPVSVSRNTTDSNVSTESAQLRDVSARGICFCLESGIAQGAPIALTHTRFCQKREEQATGVRRHASKLQPPISYSKPLPPDGILNGRRKSTLGC